MKKMYKISKSNEKILYFFDTAAINFKDPELLESSNPILVSFVNLQKLTFQECSDIPNIYIFAPAEKFFSCFEVITTTLT